MLLKSATALERVARVDTVVLDKTGMLTEGRPSLEDLVSADALRLAASLAGASRHPLDRALCRALPDVPVAGGVEEVSGQGLRAGAVRLGSRRWCGIAKGAGEGLELWLTRPDHVPVRFAFRDQLRADASTAVAVLRARPRDRAAVRRSHAGGGGSGARSASSAGMPAARPPTRPRGWRNWRGRAAAC